MTNFEKAFEELIGIEGGYVNDPTDRGGETKYGISKRSYPHLDIKNLTLQEAKDIYYLDYWRAINLTQIEHYPIALELFDTGVNMGPGTAGRLLQKALNLLNRNERNFEDLVVDGIIGNNTLHAYTQVTPQALLKTLNGLQFMRYVDICLTDRSQEKYFNGWLVRV